MAVVAIGIEIHTAAGVGGVLYIALKYGGHVVVAMGYDAVKCGQLRLSPDGLSNTIRK